MDANRFLMPVALVTVAGLFAFTSMTAIRIRSNTPPPRPPPPPARIRPAPLPIDAVPPAPAHPTFDRDLDREVLDRIATFDDDAADDLFPDRPYRVDLQRTGGANRVTVTAEIDLDRDGVIDENWQIGEARVRAVSTADDGTYDETYDLTRGGWLLRGSVDWTAVAERARIDGNIRMWWGRRLRGTERLNAGAAHLPFQVDLFQSEGAAEIDRIHLDLDRDGLVDEVFRAVEGRIERSVSPDDDGNCTDNYVWRDRDWIPVP